MPCLDVRCSIVAAFMTLIPRPIGCCGPTSWHEWRRLFVGNDEVSEIRQHLLVEILIRPREHLRRRELAGAHILRRLTCLRIERAQALGVDLRATADCPRDFAAFGQLRLELLAVGSPRLVMPPRLQMIGIGWMICSRPFKIIPELRAAKENTIELDSRDRQHLARVHCDH